MKRGLGLMAGLVLLLPATVRAQLAVFTFDGTTETPVGAAFNYGQVASGDARGVRFRVFNNGTSPVVVYDPLVSGAGFAKTAVNGSVPFTIPPVASTLNFFEFTVTFSAGAPATYSASLQITGPAITTISILLVATALPGATLVAIEPGCSPGSSGISLGSPNIGSQAECDFTLTNNNAAPVVISSLKVSGDTAFSLQNAPAMPLTIAPKTSASFAVQLKPRCGTATYSGTLNVNTTPYALSGNGITPPLPKPSLNFDAAGFASMEQHTISLMLPSPSACGATGNLTLAFTPAASLPDDSTIVFVSRSARSLPFTVAAGSSQVLIDGKTSATFGTGSTAGTIAFSMSGSAIDGGSPVAAFNIAPAAVFIDSATASNQRLGSLDLTVIGYDNTYSVGKMSFTFFDAAGKKIGSDVPADFSSNFQKFFSAQQIGSTFLMRISFPVQGSCVPAANTPNCVASQVVARMQATITNSAGQTQTAMLTLQ